MIVEKNIVLGLLKSILKTTLVGGLMRDFDKKDKRREYFLYSKFLPRWALICKEVKTWGFCKVEASHQGLEHHWHCYCFREFVVLNVFGID